MHVSVAPVETGTGQFGISRDRYMYISEYLIYEDVHAVPYI